MTTFGIFIVGSWVGFVFGILFTGMAGMLSRRDEAERVSHSSDYGHGAELGAHGHAASRV